MINIDYSLTGMTSLRYFVPIVELGNSLNITSNFYVGRSNKYNCPSKHLEILESISKRYKILFKPIEDLKFSSNPSLFVEADGINHKSVTSKSYTINFCTDYITSYTHYIDKVDYLIFPSEYFSSKIDKNYSHKFLNIGSPKFDSKINQNIVRKKYDLNQEKYVTLFYPRLRDAGSLPVEIIVEVLNQKGYSVLIKSRKKDPVNLKFNDVNKVFYDTDWYPHTSMELMTVSDFVINTSSMAIEESICLGKPIINFDIKPFDQVMPELFSNSMCINRKFYERQQFDQDIDEIRKIINNTRDIDNIRKKFFNNIGCTTEKFLDIILT